MSPDMILAGVIWFVLAIVFLIVELACPIHLVSCWFSAGAAVATLSTLLSSPVWLQILLFFIVSCSLLAVFWPLVKGYLNPGVTKTNVDAVIGAQGIVTGTIDNLKSTGQVKIGGMPWSARSADGEPIAEGTCVKVERIEGVKVFVSPQEVKVEN